MSPAVDTLSQIDIEPSVLLDSEPRSLRIATWVILAASAVVFVIQLQSLYTFPIVDSVRWGGDETWLMREFGNQARHGVMAYPESFNGTLRTDGVLAGSMWVEALLYGAMGNAFAADYSFVEIGRTVTAVLSALLLLLLWISCRSLGVSRVLSSLAVLLVTSAETFVISTHSARYDILIGLSLLGFVLVLGRTAGRRTRGAGLFVLSALAIGLIIFGRHLLTLGAPVTLLWLWRQRVWETAGRLITTIAGGLAAGVAILLAYYLPSRDLSLFGIGGGFGSYDFVLKQLPILRPLSRSVQLGNLHERYDLLTREAPGLLLAILTALVLLIAYLLWKAVLRFIPRSVHVSSTSAQKFFVTSAVLTTLSWLLLQGARPYYAMHMLPVLIVAAVVIFQWLQETFESAPLLRYPVPTLLLLLAIVQLPTAIRSHETGAAITRDQRAAIQKFSQETVGSTVLADVAGLNWALLEAEKNRTRVMTLDMFQPPASADALRAKLAASQIDYVILRSSPVSSAFEPGRAFLPSYLPTAATVVDSSLGLYYDDGRSYDSSLDYVLRQGLDTLRLYKLNSARP